MSSYEEIPASFCNISAFFGPTPGRYMMERLSRSSIYKYLFCKQRLCHQQIERSRNLYILPVSRNSLDRMPESLHNRSIVGKQFRVGLFIRFQKQIIIENLRGLHRLITRTIDDGSTHRKTRGENRPQARPG